MKFVQLPILLVSLAVFADGVGSSNQFIRGGSSKRSVLGIRKAPEEQKDCGFHNKEKRRNEPSTFAVRQQEFVAQAFDNKNTSLERRRPSRFCIVTRTIGSVGMYMACIWTTAAKANVFSPLWFVGNAGVVLSSVLMGRSVKPTMTMNPNLERQVSFEALFAAHLLTASSPVILGGMVLKSSTALMNTVLVVTSLLITMAGSASEIVAHSYHDWKFDASSKAYKGFFNQVFSASLIGGFSFLAAALTPSWKAIAFAATASLLSLALLLKGKLPKAADYGMRTVASGWLAWAVRTRFSTYWPILYFCQAFNITSRIRNTKRMLNGYTQQIHLLTSLYGWFSYVFAFGLSLHPAAQTAGLWTVIVTCLFSIVASDKVEQWVQQEYIKKAGNITGRQVYQ